MEFGFGMIFAAKRNDKKAIKNLCTEKIARLIKNRFENPISCSLSSHHKPRNLDLIYVSVNTHPSIVAQQ
jgi:hypothetical protein